MWILWVWLIKNTQWISSTYKIKVKLFFSRMKRWAVSKCKLNCSAKIITYHTTCNDSTDLLENINKTWRSISHNTVRGNYIFKLCNICFYTWRPMQEKRGYFHSVMSPSNPSWRVWSTNHTILKNLLLLQQIHVFNLCNFQLHSNLSFVRFEWDSSFNLDLYQGVQF